MAALWERWPGQAGSGDAAAIDSCAILTTEANERVALVHDRMPVIVAREDYARWLDPALEDPAELADLLRPCPPGWIELQPVGPRVNDPREDDAGLLLPERDLFSP
jgi:putative SOS response-associated peptidase YedK